ncbi:MAG: AI-2E family transporter [Ornithinimicrobium sp.]|uniref:AI-2E family transporter n=1 Tax=Ornithinimicrobium sp. TaxID=1977084 RepID=UPI003D9BF806
MSAHEDSDPPVRRLRVPSRLNPVTVPRVGARAVQRWQDYRERQLELLAESNELRREMWERPQPRPAAPPETAPTGPSQRLVALSSPFFIGFVGALGVLTAIFLAGNLSRLSAVLTVLAMALFLTLVLNPIVEVFTRRGMRRQMGVLIVFSGLIAVFAALGYLVAPPVVEQTTTLVERTPRYLEDLAGASWATQLNAQFDISQRMTTEFDARMSDNAFVSTVFGGVLGAAGWVAGGVVGFLTTLILTLYLLATLPSVKDGAYKLVPASRRPRVIALAEEIMRRVGSYALGQISVASINAFCTWVLLEVLGLPYPVVLAVLVGFLGLIPMIGAILGAVIVASVALAQDPTLALVVVIYYVVYQQIENYVIVPRIMARTVSVPGAVTVTSVLIGGTLLGVLGALVAIPIAAGLLLLYEEVVVPRQSRL